MTTPAAGFLVGMVTDVHSVVRLSIFMVKNFLRRCFDDRLAPWPECPLGVLLVVTFNNIYE